LYQQATLFITASRDEGFNIPPLEAMACGVPVVCSDIQVHQELFADAARFFDVDNPADLATKIDQTVTDADANNQYTQAGYERVAVFTWENAAKQVASALQYLKG